MPERWQIALQALRRDYEVGEIAAMLANPVHKRTVAAWSAGEYLPVKPRQRQLVKLAAEKVAREFKRLCAAEGMMVDE